MKFSSTAHQFLGDVLPLDFRQELFDLVENAWSRVSNPDEAWLEPRITGLFQQAIIAGQESRYNADPPFFILEDQKKRDPKTGVEKERSDVEIHLRRHYIKGQKPYFVFESKRLNIPYEHGFKTNADEYIGDGGMGCLVSGQYETVPSFSGMLAYVMDGNVPSARRAVELAIEKNAAKLKLQGKHQIHNSNLMPKGGHHGETRHFDETGDFTMFHMFFGIVLQS